MPIAAGAVLVLLTTLVGGFALANASGAASDTRGDAYADTLALSRARIAAYDAKSNESLTLIARGSGDAFEEGLQGVRRHGRRPTRTTSDTDGPRLHQPLERLQERARRPVRKDDDSGNWDQAVDMADRQRRSQNVQCRLHRVRQAIRPSSLNATSDADPAPN